MNTSHLFVNARLWSGALLPADALLVQDGHIAGIGAAAALRARAPDAMVHDADGGTLTPGLTDAHLHLTPWARARRQPDLHGATRRGAVLERVAAALAALPPGDDPLVGRGWDETDWEAAPDRHALDAIAPSRPVLLHRHDFHALWVNSAALAAAGVSRATPDPAGGCFERDDAGDPTGLVREHAVQAFAGLEDRAAPVLDDALLDEAAAALHAAGITTVHDYQRNHADWQRMHALASRHRLRVLQMIGPESLRDRAHLGLAAGAGDAWFRTGSLKLFADGTLGSRTAAMLAPYDDADTTGMALLSRRELDEAVGEAARAGFSVTIHAIGDAAVRYSLDAIEAHHAWLARCPLPPRIEHVQLLDPADRARFAALGVIASMQPQHAVSDAVVARRAWGARCAHAYPWRALLDSGATLAFGSDAPVEPPLAALGLAAGVARLGSDGAPFEPAQCLTLDEVLVAYTRGPALTAGGLFGPGTLTVGAVADLVVWDRDLHAQSAAGLAPARPRLTLLGGGIVFASSVGPRDPREGADVPGQGTS